MEKQQEPKIEELGDEQLKEVTGGKENFGEQSPSDCHIFKANCKRFDPNSYCDCLEWEDGFGGSK